MNKFKLLFAPIACFVMSLIVTIAWSAGLQWSESSNFAIALIFWILCIICIVVSIFLLPIVNIDFPFKVAIVLLDILYTGGAIAGDAARRPDPDRSVRGFGQVPDLVPRQVCRIVSMGCIDRYFLPVHPIQPVPGSDPQTAPAVQQQRCDIRLGQAVFQGDRDIGIRRMLCGRYPNRRKEK